MTNTPRTRWMILSTMTAAGLLGVLALGSLRSGSEPPTTAAQGPVAATYHVQTDHAVYPTVDELKAAADTVVTATIESHTTDPGTSPGVDGAGDPLPAVPHTDYAVQVEKAWKGAPVAGDSLIVSMVGGTTAEGNFLLDGGPTLQEGTTSLLFMGTRDGGKYYPLAGGAAIAQRQQDGTYLLPNDASGTQNAVPIAESELSGPAAPPAAPSDPSDSASPTPALSLKPVPKPPPSASSKRTARATVKSRANGSRLFVREQRVQDQPRVR